MAQNPGTQTQEPSHLSGTASGEEGPPPESTCKDQVVTILCYSIPDAYEYSGQRAIVYSEEVTKNKMKIPGLEIVRPTQL